MRLYKTSYIAVYDERPTTFPCDCEQGEVSAVTTLTQHAAGSSTQCSKARKGNKRQTDYIKEKIKLSLLADDRLKIHV